MRLIDADALKEKFIDANAEGINLAIDRYALKCIDDAPTIEPERKTGTWMRYGEDGNPNTEDTVFWQCSECMETYTGRTTRISNYCPNCGADMRER